MPDISFPSNPSPNDTYTFGGKTWIWTGSYWALNTAGAINNVPVGNVTPSTGAFTTLSATGNITGDYFLGNGSQLTGLPAGYANANVVAYGEAGWAGNIIPSANITYDLGTSTNRWQDIWLANSTIYLGEANISASGTAVVLPAGTTIGGSPAEMPKIANVQITNSSWTVLDDTAISTDGGYFIVNGSGFQSGATVTVDGTNASSVTFISSNLLRCQIGAKAAASYTVYVINPDGGTALRPSGLTYSGLPTWVTASQLANATANTAFTYTLSATGAVSYALAPGNTVPTGSTLAGNGVFSGNVAVANSTSYSFTVTATDAEQQDADRTFSLNVNTVAPPGQIVFTSVGNTSWTVPDGVTLISAVLVGGGGGGGSASGGGGGGLRYINDLPVTGGETLTIQVGNGGSSASSGGITRILRSANVLVAANGGGAGLNATGNTFGAGGTGTTIGVGPFGGTIGGGTGGNGGATDDSNFGPGGGGAGGYAGTGGWGGSAGGLGSGDINGTSGTGGAGGGGGLSRGYSGYQVGGGGGGVGLLGQGTSGTGGAYTGTQGGAGVGGSDGTNGNGAGTGAGGTYGGGGAADNGSGAQGAVRILWGGSRSYPSNAGNV